MDKQALQQLLTAPSGKHIAVVGGGKTGAYASALLLRLGAQVTLFDEAAPAQVEAALAKHRVLVERPQVVCGPLVAEALSKVSAIVLSPGVPRAHPAIAAALAAGVPVVNEMDLAACHLPSTIRVAGITGTNGKSTTTTVLGAIFAVADAHAFAGGNLGTPYCDAALRVLAGEPAPRFVALELSSYQLETLTLLRLQAAVVTNLAPDHLDRYANVDAYYAAKLKMVDLLEADGVLVLNAKDPQSLRVFGAVSVARLDIDVDAHALAHGPGLCIDGSVLHIRRQDTTVTSLALSHPHLVGRHNQQNAAGAIAAALSCGVSLDDAAAGLARYAGIAHRLERVGAHQGVTWFNDSKATNVDAAVTAVKSFAGGVHLIAGGLGKGAPYAPLVDVARGRVRAVYTIGADAEAIAQAFAGAVAVVPCGDLATACRVASAAAVDGDAVLLSPACASFDQFKDYADRGEQFRVAFAVASGGAR